MNIKWILEFDVLTEVHERLKVSAEKAGHSVVAWNDDWEFSRPSFNDLFIMFHGSLGIASQIIKDYSWKPGAYCNINSFLCSSWYNQVPEYLLNDRWVKTTVQEFVDGKVKFFDKLNSSDNVFVRPDSPLKPFSGRTINKEDVSLKALDYGFYYEDSNLPIILAPVKKIESEWRFVVSGKKIITGSGYMAEGRFAMSEITSGPEWDYSNMVAKSLIGIDPMYVLDICKSEGEFKLLELNPFSGADLYSCNTCAIVEALEIHSKQK